MARVGRIQVSCDYGNETPYVVSYRVMEIESIGKTFLGITSEEAPQSSVTWFDDVSLDNIEHLGRVFNLGGINTYTWLSPMTEVPDEETGVTLPISISDVTNLQSILDSKAPASHTHTISNITNLQSTLDGKADADHTHVTPCCTITGSSSSQSLTAGTMTRVSLNTFSINTDSSCFSAYDNGVKVAKAGYYQISASAYMTCSTTSGIRVIHVHQNNTELASVRSEEGGTYASQGGIAIAPKVVYLNAGDVIYLKVRSLSSAGTLIPNNCATYLSIVKM